MLVQSRQSQSEELQVLHLCTSKLTHSKSRAIAASNPPAGRMESAALRALRETGYEVEDMVWTGAYLRLIVRLNIDALRQLRHGRLL